MSLYLIGIGGTGSKCIEAVIQLAAIGLFSNTPIKVLFIDPDESNGNLERSQNFLKLHQKCSEIINGEKQSYSWMKTPISAFELWSPFAKTSINKNLSSFFNYNNLKQNYQELGNLFDALYTTEERTVDLDVGFRGRPAIGSAVMSQVNLNSLDDEPWRSLINQIEAGMGGGSETKILLCGSIFGGTGASGLPTIGSLLANKFKGKRDKVKIGCLFMLPYFGFSPPAGEDPDGFYAQFDLFLLNTEAALRYYQTQAKEIFDAVYLLGNQNYTQVKFSIGKNTQRNDPHFLELYGALAARQFFLSPCNIDRPVSLIGRHTLGKVTWKDIPDRSVVQPEIVNATRFAYAWLASTLPELQTAKERGIPWAQRNIPWFSRFFRPQSFMGNAGKDLPEFSDSKEQNAIDIVTKWCQQYLAWLHSIHQCEGEDIELFNSNSLLTPKIEMFSNLVIGDSRDKSKKIQDTISELNVKLISQPKNLEEPNQGAAGLAKAIYILSRISN
ncbi:tubulin-like doman-containing protein [Calothrix sp. UHCC 0171]|uniref:tubulin-like doman-containing protein n=1 Tax=Calothrix sp. UHCC 0171 TaxID=3110245 RepID=UPI002B21A6C4|nr:tubulin-like doman-containing protein [Calothrix sp. UHCC 0171]MEA5572382.1 tubulin-like doman-containing protein [Calothrix sp. UHCC 0171]